MLARQVVVGLDPVIDLGWKFESNSNLVAYRAPVVEYGSRLYWMLIIPCGSLGDNYPNKILSDIAVLDLASIGCLCIHIAADGCD